MTDTITSSVQCYRFSADPAAMIAFLEALGLVRSVSTEGDGYALMRAAGGSVGVHAASGSSTGAVPGQTQLCLEVASVDDVAGIEGVQVWDESYGRQAGVTDSFGGGIWIDERQSDLYGYTDHDDPPRAGLFVTAVRYSPAFAPDVELFARFGLAAGQGDEWWQPLTAADGSVVGLHKPSGQPITAPASENPVGDNSVCDLGFETTEPLEGVRDRLVAAGYDASLHTDEVGTAVHVTDPDGCHVEVHQRR